MCRKEPRNVSPALQMAQPSPATPDKETNYIKCICSCSFLYLYLYFMYLYIFYLYLYFKESCHVPPALQMAQPSPATPDKETTYIE